MGISYIFITVEEEPRYTALERTKIKYQDQIYSGNFSIGIQANFDEKWRIYSQVIYKYSDEMNLDDKNYGRKINFSGIYLYFGISRQI